MAFYFTGAFQQCLGASRAAKRKFMQCKRASFTSLREVLQIAKVRMMNARMRTIAYWHVPCSGKGTFSDTGLAGYGVFPYALCAKCGGRA